MTYDALNVFCLRGVYLRQIDIMSMLSEMGITSSKMTGQMTMMTQRRPMMTMKPRPEKARLEPRRQNHQSVRGTDRTDDPVRMYLREMGSVELLSREAK